MDNTRKPRWSKWRLMPEVKAWEAVALSLNIEPEKVKSDSNAWMGAQFPFDEGDEFNDRLSIVVANIGHPAHFPTACTLSLNGGYLCGVRLAEFATFGVSYAEWDLPSEFAALAAHDDAETIPVKPAPVFGGDEGQVCNTAPDAGPMQYKNGAATLWTAERIAEARAMQNRLKGEGNKAFARLTADHYGVTTTRLRAVLKEEVPVTKAKQQKKTGPWDVLGT